MVLKLRKIFKLKLVLIILGLIFTTSSLYSQSLITFKQSESKKNSIFVEGLGHGFLYSLNYERLILNKGKYQLSGQVGISYYGKDSGIIPLWMPISLNQTINFSQSKFFEVGIGKMLINDGVDYGNGVFVDNYQLESWIFRIGYKQYLKNDKFLLKIAYTPILLDKSDFIHWGGVSFGYRF